MSVYICIDLKSFYASVECVERGLNPLTTNLVVADSSRTEKTICLAVSPSLKDFGIPSRPRLFEVVQKVKDINSKRAKSSVLSGESCDINILKQFPELKLNYIIATPQMAKYIDISSKIYNVYLKYVSSEDIHVYSIDEVFIDITRYLKYLNKTPHEIAMLMIKDVLSTTGITATAGIGTNLYLAKVAMDIVAKHIPPDEDGVRIAYLDEMSYRKKLWSHKPLKDFWRIGHGYVERLEKLGLFTMGDIARCSLGDNDDYYNEDLLYKEFGINAELLIDHAWGYEPTTMKDIKDYKPQSTSLSSGQVLQSGYDYNKGKVVVKEMIDNLSLDLVEKKLLTCNISLYIGYEYNDNYQGICEINYYGKKVPKSSHGSINLNDFTSSTKKLVENISFLYDKIVDKNLLIRRINIACNGLIKEENYKKIKKYEQINLFCNYEDKLKKEEIEKVKDLKEKKVQKAILNIKKKYGKNAILKGNNFIEGATGKERNKQIGGHKA